VRWKVGGVFGVAAMAGAFVGGRVAGFLSPHVLLVAFGGLMVAAAAAMLRGKRRSEVPAASPPSSAVLSLGLGMLVGMISGLVGAGGGFLIVPVLATFGRLETREAIGTSLFVIALQSLAGFAGHATHTALDWELLVVVASVTVPGGLVGAYFGKRVAATTLRSVFAALLVAMAIFVFVKELPTATALGASASSIALVGYVACRSLRATHLSARESRHTQWKIP
jgi:uncharacterized membrane protein YfcA